MNRVDKIDNLVKVQNVLLSVSDKSDLDYVVNNLIRINENIKMYSTGGTYTKIKEILGDSYKKNLISVSDYTGQPEMQGGLVKTLDFKIYLGLLSETYNDDHNNDLKRLNAVNFDLVLVNLYPFEKTVADQSNSSEDARANIDIGGPCMLRASSKNFIRTAAVCNPSDYKELIQELDDNNGCTSLETRLKYSIKGFEHTSKYDTAIFNYLSKLKYEDVKNIYNFMK